VRLHGNFNEQNKLKGLVTSKGFTDVNIYYQIYDHFNMISNYR
jgi:hypothetical protein